MVRLLPERAAAGALPLSGMAGVSRPRRGRGAVDRPFSEAGRNSPASTTLALQAARAAVKALQLGERGRKDLFDVALSGVDGVGPQFGTLARERVDTVLRTHAELGAFLAELRARLGPRLSVLLTSDHGLTPMEADEKRLRVGQGGTENIDELLPRVEKALVDELGPREGGWVAGIEGSTLQLRKPFPRRALALAVRVPRREPAFFSL